MVEHYVGLMSGTSLDAIDAVLCSLDETNRFQQLAQISHPLPSDLRKALLALTQPGDNEIERLAIAEPAFARTSAAAVKQLLQSAGMRSEQIIAIGSHGQTIRHRPDMGYTLQIGDPSVIAELTGITVVGDFRRRDVAAGGQGAPLVPAFHQAAFSSVDENRVIVNIGGMGNISILSNERTATGFDTGPGNVLMDHWCMEHLQTPYDNNGQWAASVDYDQPLLQQLMDHAFFKATPPKSTGRELFNIDWLHHQLKTYSTLSAAIIQSTLCQLTVESICREIERHAPETQAVYLCGGGAHNQEILRRIECRLPDCQIATTDVLGVPPDWVEAVCFAWLAKQTLLKEPANMPAVTGAAGRRILGAVYPA